MSTWSYMCCIEVSTLISNPPSRKSTTDTNKHSLGYMGDTGLVNLVNMVVKTNLGRGWFSLWIDEFIMMEFGEEPLKKPVRLPNTWGCVKSSFNMKSVY